MLGTLSIVRKPSSSCRMACILQSTIELADMSLQPFTPAATPRDRLDLNMVSLGERHAIRLEDPLSTGLDASPAICMGLVEPLGTELWIAAAW